MNVSDTYVSFGTSGSDGVKLLFRHPIILIACYSDSLLSDNLLFREPGQA